MSAFQYHSGPQASETEFTNYMTVKPLLNSKKKLPFAQPCKGPAIIAKCVNIINPAKPVYKAQPKSQ